MLQAAANTAPTGVYVCGHTSTAAGLTVSQSCGHLQNHKTSLHIYVHACRFMFSDSEYVDIYHLY